jgi:hypothetical protein
MRIDSNFKVKVPINTHDDLPLRVLDVERSIDKKCLYITKCTNWDFYAVSHCWGMKRKNWLERANLELAYPLKELKGMGIKSIWIDVLCINQEDSKEVQQEIMKMSSIYGNSLATLIFTNGMFNKPRIVSDGVIEPWFDRVWTYQEFIIPKQVWFIVDKNVYERETDHEINEKKLLGQNMVGITASDCMMLLLHLSSKIPKTSASHLGEMDSTRMWRKYRELFFCRTDAEKTVTFYDIFNNSMQRQCEKPGDKINGILGAFNINNWYVDCNMNSEKAQYQFIRDVCQKSMYLSCLLSVSTSYNSIYGSMKKYSWVLPMNNSGLLDGIRYEIVESRCVVTSAGENITFESEISFRMKVVLSECSVGDLQGDCKRTLEVTIGDSVFSSSDNYCVHGSVDLHVGGYYIRLSIPEMCNTRCCCATLGSITKQIEIDAVAVLVASIIISDDNVDAFSVIAIEKVHNNQFIGRKIGIVTGKDKNFKRGKILAKIN